MQQKVKNTKTVPPHLCCADSFWLYRIYQNTFVDLDMITGLIQDALVESYEFLKQINDKSVDYTQILPTSIVRVFPTHSYDLIEDHLLDRRT